MIKVLILVEGQTEEAFVKNLLASHLRGLGVIAIPVIVATKRLLTGDKKRGGYQAVEKRFFRHFLFKKPNDYEGHFSKTWLFQQPAMCLIHDCERRCYACLMIPVLPA